MGLVQDIPLLLEEFKAQTDRIEHDRVLYEIFEGDLKTHLCAALRAQLSPKSYEQAVHRLAPINVLPRIIGKLSIYGKVPARSLDEGSAEKDTKLWADVEKELKLNDTMAMANRLFNLHKRAWIEPFLDQGKPQIRVIPSHKFLVYSNDHVNPLRPTHFVKIMGKFKDTTSGEERVLFYGYTKDEFVAFDSKGEIVQAKMTTNGANPLKRLPGVYVNRSKSELVPLMDSDTLPMTLLIPIILTDVNYAHMFSHFPVFYGVDLTDEGLTRAPNSFWKFKSDPSSQTTPQVGILEANADSSKSIELVKAQLSFWMQARNIKPGAMGSFTVENAASGIAKAIDEMDTSEDRQNQVPIFQDTEEEVARMIVETYHPDWMRNAEYKFRGVGFSSGVVVGCKFPEQRPIVDTSKAIDDQKKKIDMGIQDEFGAMKELYPDMTDKEIEEHLQRVQKRKLERMKEAQAAMGENPEGEEQDSGKPPGAAPKGAPGAEADAE
jgi:hypothetical protein